MTTHQGNPVVSGGPASAGLPRKVWYTGKTYHATAGSRSNASTALLAGHVLCMDPAGHDKGKGIDYCEPTTGILGARKVIVIDVPSGQGVAGTGGWVTVSDSEAYYGAIQVEGTTDIALGDMLKVVTAQLYLIKSAGLADGAGAAVKEIGTCATAWAAFTTNGTGTIPGTFGI